MNLTYPKGQVSEKNVKALAEYVIGLLQPIDSEDIKERNDFIYTSARKYWPKCL